MVENWELSIVHSNVSWWASIEYCTLRCLKVVKNWVLRIKHQDQVLSIKYCRLRCLMVVEGTTAGSPLPTTGAEQRHWWQSEKMDRCQTKIRNRTLVPGKWSLDVSFLLEVICFLMILTPSGGRKRGWRHNKIPVVYFGLKGTTNQAGNTLMIQGVSLDCLLARE